MQVYGFWTWVHWVLFWGLTILFSFICEFSYFSLGLVIKAQRVRVLLGLGITVLVIYLYGCNAFYLLQKKKNFVKFSEAMKLIWGLWDTTFYEVWCLELEYSFSFPFLNFQQLKTLQALIMAL